MSQKGLKLVFAILFASGISWMPGKTALATEKKQMKFFCGDHWFSVEGVIEFAAGIVRAEFDGEGITTRFIRKGKLTTQAWGFAKAHWVDHEGGIQFVSDDEIEWQAELFYRTNLTVVKPCHISFHYNL